MRNGRWGAIVGLIYGAWFVRTKSLGSVILAHGVTNLLLALYCLFWNDWHFSLHRRAGAFLAFSRGLFSEINDARDSRCIIPIWLRSRSGMDRGTQDDAIGGRDRPCRPAGPTSTVFSGPFIFDDLGSIPYNKSIRHLWPIGGVLFPGHEDSATINGRPLVNLSFALNYTWGGHVGAGLSCRQSAHPYFVRGDLAGRGPAHAFAAGVAGSFRRTLHFRWP